MKALSRREADQIIPAAERKQARKTEALQTREQYALDELAKLGWRIGLHEPARYVEADPLRGVTEGFRSGTCVATLVAIDGRRKQLTGISAVEVLDHARAWHKYQDGLKDDAPNRFIVAFDDVPEARVRQQEGSENALRARGGENPKRIISFQSGVAEVVASHGLRPVEENRASQYGGANNTKGENTR